MNYQVNVKQDPNLIYAWFTGAEIVGNPYAELCYEGIYTVAGAPSNIAGLYIPGAIVKNAADGIDYVNSGTTDSPNFTAIGGGSGILTTKVSLSSAQILNLGSVPVTLVASPGVGKFIQILSVTGRMNFGTVAYDTSTHLQVFTGALAGISFTDQNLLGSRFTINYAFNGPANVNTDEDVPVQIQVELANPATGDGTLDIYVTYKIITL